MSQKEKEALEKLRDAVETLPPEKQDYILGYAEAVADMKKQQGPKESA